VTSETEEVKIFRILFLLEMGSKRFYSQNFSLFIVKFKKSEFSVPLRYSVFKVFTALECMLQFAAIQLTQVADLVLSFHCSVASYLFRRKLTAV